MKPKYMSIGSQALRLLRLIGSCIVMETSCSAYEVVLPVAEVMLPKKKKVKKKSCSYSELFVHVFSWQGAPSYVCLALVLLEQPNNTARIIPSTGILCSKGLLPR